MKRIVFALSALLVLAVGCKKEVEPTSVRLNQSELAMTVGETVKLTATIAPSNVTNSAVKWSSSKPAVANVDKDGQITALSEGQASITVTTMAGGLTDACIVTVSKKTVPVTGVKLDKETLELAEGETAVLTATVLPENATDKTLEWRTSDVAVATVDQGGKVTAIGGGKARITVRCGSVEASCEVTVKMIEVTGVSVEPASVTIKEGETIQLFATVNPADADQSVEWASENNNIAKVNENGLVTGYHEGTARIFARSKAFTDKQGICEVNVIKDPALKGIAFSASEISLDVGQAYMLTIVYTPSYAENKTVSWNTSDEAIASVSSEGKVVALSEGTATITATSEEGGYTASCTVNVRKNASGLRVYYCPLSYHGVYVNGEPDPLDGAFEVSAHSLTGVFGGSAYLFSDGHDLYSLEVYQYDWGQITRYLCKNRKPLFEVQKEDPQDDIVSASARNGKVALLFQRAYHAGYYVKFVNPDGSSTISDLTGDYTDVKNYITGTIAPNGDYLIAARIQDSFYDYYLALFRYSSTYGWSESLVENNWASDPSICVSENGDVYVMDYFVERIDNFHDGYSAVLYKNGVKEEVFPQENCFYYAALHVANGHVYTATLLLDDAGTVIERCDGTIVREFKAGAGQEFEFQVEHPLYVTATGDFYLATTNYIFKNDTKLYTTVEGEDRIFNFCVVE